jgi:hypothetical protein
LEKDKTQNINPNTEICNTSRTMAKGDKENFEIISEHLSAVFSHIIMIRTRKCNNT